MTVVVPIDVYRSSAIHEKTYNVLQDYATLHVAMVANGTTWIQNWIKSKAIRENIALTLEFLRNNTSAELWGKPYEEHQEYRAYQQGGPLMLFLIMKRILDVSKTVEVPVPTGPGPHVHSSLANAAGPSTTDCLTRFTVHDAGDLHDW